MRFSRSVARNRSRAGVRQRLVAARRLVVGSACQSTGESWRSLGHTVGRVTVTGDGCRFGRTVCLPAAAQISLRLGEPCDRGRRQRLTAHCPVKKKLRIVIVIIAMQPVCLCRRTPFMMISSLHVTKVMMLIMIMTTRRDCGSVCNLYASAVGHVS